MTAGPPTWNAEEKAASLHDYAGWLNEQARSTFLKDGTHADLWFLLQDDGQGHLIPTPPEMDKDDLAAALREAIEQGNIYGIIHIAEVWGYRPHGENDHTARQIVDGEIPVAELKDADRGEALMVQMESRDGDKQLWIHTIARDGEHATLAECREIPGSPEGRMTGWFDECSGG
jgi:hypothetical protein